MTTTTQNTPKGSSSSALQKDDKKSSRHLRPNETNQGNSSWDIALIFAAYFALYTFLLFFFCLLVKGAIDTDEKHTLLWSFFFFAILFCTIVGFSVKFGTQYNVERKCSETGNCEKADDKLENEALV
jgi:hypothetical protein